jgi:hypothetical protein
VTDLGLKQLTGLTSLRSLSLFGLPVTDKGLKELADLTALERLDLRQTKVTDKGIAELKKSLPKCKVER